MHPGDNVDHSVEGGVVRVDDHVDAVAEDVQIGVGDQGRNLDQPVGAQIETGHLTVNPYQFIPHSA